MSKGTQGPGTVPMNAIGNLYTTAEVAQLLKITPRSLQRYIAAGEIQAFLIGGGYRIHEDEVRRFLESRLSELPGREDCTWIGSVSDPVLQQKRIATSAIREKDVRKIFV